MQYEYNSEVSNQTIYTNLDISITNTNTNTTSSKYQVDITLIIYYYAPKMEFYFIISNAFSRPPTKTPS